MGKKLTNKQFIEMAIVAHGDKYDYSRVLYVGNRTNVKIICREHGEFEQSPKTHLKGHGCSKCSRNCLLNTEDFINKSKRIHKDRYDYSKVRYINHATKIIIICKKHGEFRQLPSKHYWVGAGCPKCSINHLMTTEEFVEKSKKIHGERYDYSKTRYKGGRIEVKIICKKHGEFEQTPHRHLSGRGCKRCSVNHLLDIKEFINKSRKIHGNKYDYANVKYVNSKLKVIIMCKKHGRFEQVPKTHLKGSGCPACGKINMSFSKTKKQDKFIKEANEIHSNKYNYSKVNYINGETKIEIICKKHGEFQQNANNHLRGNGCPFCKKEQIKSTTKDFIEKSKKIHKNQYNYSKVKYVDNCTKVIIICKKHGEFEQLPGNHLRGCGCNKCAGKYLSNAEEFIKKAKEIYGNKYDYSKTKYINSKTKTAIICKKHGEFKPFAGSHLQGHDCPYCVRKSEGKVKELLYQYFKDWTIIPHKKIWETYKNYKHRRYCDFWLEKDGRKIIVEYDGQQHFKPVRFWGISSKKAKELFEDVQLKDSLDKQFCKENDIFLCRIKYTDNKESLIEKTYRNMKDGEGDV